MQNSLPKRIQWILGHTFLTLTAVVLLIIGVIFGVMLVESAVLMGVLAVVTLMAHGTWMGMALMREDMEKSGSEKDLRMLPEIERLIVHGFATMVAIGAAIAGPIFGWMTIGGAVSLGLLAILLITGHGMWFGMRRIQEDAAAATEKPKRKRDEVTGLALSDDGELVEYYEEDEEAARQARI